ncbi:hypothetical protein T09_276 [Trichinella sp. T9]|nr:hypothetical protein T09_276 [Trichinella sp. T9]
MSSLVENFSSNNSMVPLLALKLLIAGILIACPCRGLICYMCATSPGAFDHVTTDNFRIKVDLRLPFCRRLETVQCDRDQNACLSILTYMPETNSYWLGKGCTKIREPFESIGCTSSSTTHLEAPIGDQISQRAHISSGQTMQDVCLCNRNYCNASTRARFSITLTGSLIIIIIAIFHYWCRM